MPVSRRCEEDDFSDQKDFARTMCLQLNNLPRARAKLLRSSAPSLRQRSSSRGWFRPAPLRGAQRERENARTPSLLSANVSMLRALARRAGGTALRASTPSRSSRRVLPRLVPFLSPRVSRPPPSSRAVPPLGVGAAIASVGARSVLGLAVKTAKLRGARRAYRGLLSESSRTRVRRLVLGADASGAARRVVVLATTTGGALYLLVDTVPATGRRRLMLFSHDDEAAIARAHLADAFETLDGAFAPPHDPRTRRVAAVTWTLVSTLDPALALNTDATRPSPRGARPPTTLPPVRRRRRRRHIRCSARGSRWTVHGCWTPTPTRSCSPAGTCSSTPVSSTSSATTTTRSRSS